RLVISPSISRTNVVTTYLFTINDRTLSARMLHYNFTSRMHGYARHLAAVAAFRWRQHAQRFGPIDGGNRRWAVARVAATGFVAQGFQNFLRGDWHFVDAHAYGVVDRVGNGGWYGEQRSLSNFFRAEGTVGVGVFNQVGLDVAHLHRRWALVF